MDLRYCTQSRYQLRQRILKTNICVKRLRIKQKALDSTIYKRKCGKRAKCKISKKVSRVSKNSNKRRLHNKEVDDPNISENDDDIKCPICLDTQPYLNILKLNCRHSFHGECLTDWFEKQMFCPMCRTPLDKDDFKMFLEKHTAFLRKQIPERPEKNSEELAKTIQNMTFLLKQLKKLELLCRAIYQI